MMHAKASESRPPCFSFYRNGLKNKLNVKPPPIIIELGEQ